MYTQAYATYFGTTFGLMVGILFFWFSGRTEDYAKRSLKSLGSGTVMTASATFLLTYQVEKLGKFYYTEHQVATFLVAAVLVLFLGLLVSTPVERLAQRHESIGAMVPQRIIVARLVSRTVLIATLVLFLCGLTLEISILMRWVT